MKRRVNIICTLIFLAISFSLISSFVNSLSAMKAGFVEGQNMAEQEKDHDSSAFLTLAPTDESEYPDSLYNNVTQRWMPASHSTTLVRIPVSDVNKQHWVITGLLATVFTVSILTFLIVFLRIIIAINKSVIFDWSNVRKLRIAGACLLVSFISGCLTQYLMIASYSKIIDIPGYIISQRDTFDSSFLIWGLISLLVAEVFAVGLRLQEDQELTI